MVTHICISMALALSPRKYFNGKFCFNFLKSDSILQRLRYVSQTCSADISSGSSTFVMNSMVSLPSSVRLTILRQRYVPCKRSYTVTTPELGLLPRRCLSSSSVMGRSTYLSYVNSTICSAMMSFSGHFRCSIILNLALSFRRQTNL